MRVLVSEEQYRLITEASKVEILVNKVGFSQKDAEALYKIAGNLSVWLGKRLYSRLVIMLKNNSITNNDDIKDYMLTKYSLTNVLDKIRSIVDWIRVGLNGNVGKYENLSFFELYDESVSWHESLEIGDGLINYIENNKIIRDYREGGIGYYWVNLGTHDSSEECERMGHCGRTDSDNILYSLRKTTKINDNYTLNKSLLTAAIGKRDGKIYQMKGPKNTKPDKNLHPYIIDLIIKDDLIEGFGVEYNSNDDFKLSDLNTDEIKKIQQIKPELFNGRREQRLLKTIGILKGNNFDIVEIDFSDIKNFIDGGHKYNNKHIFELILTNELTNIYDNIISDYDFIFRHYINNKNLNTIKDFLILHYPEIDFDEMSYNDIINEYDYNNVITSCINWAYNDISNDDIANYYRMNLIDAFDVFGEVIEVTDTHIKLKCDIDELSENCDEINEIDDDCHGDTKCILKELIYNGDIDKGTFNPDDHYEPNVDKEEFNDLLSQYLEDI